MYLCVYVYVVSVCVCAYVIAAGGLKPGCQAAKGPLFLHGEQLAADLLLPKPIDLRACLPSLPQNLQASSLAPRAWRGNQSGQKNYQLEIHESKQ